MTAIYPKKAMQKKCPHLNTSIIVNSGLQIYFCGLFGASREKECIFKIGWKGSQFQTEDAGECSYFLFPEIHFILLGITYLSEIFQLIRNRFKRRKL